MKRTDVQSNGTIKGVIMNRSIVLETVNLGKIYNQKVNAYRALSDVNIKVHKGEFVGIMGPSGAGKSTLLNLISTIDRPTEGNVLIEGNDVFAMNENQLADFRRKKLGFIFQDYNLLDQMNVYENMTLPMALAGYSGSTQHDRAAKLSRIFGIEKLLYKKPAELSGGEKQRVTAARAIIMSPALVMADEPTGALDSKSSRNMMEVLKHMNSKYGVTIVMVTHDYFAAGYCSRIIDIRDGRVFESGEHKNSGTDAPGI